MSMMPAWECRDQSDQAEAYYNHPLRVKNRRLEEENNVLKRLLRENGISWQAPPKSPAPLASAQEPQVLPHLPVEIQLRILSYALTSPHTIVDPLCKLRPERLTVKEKAKPHYLAIHFLATCKAYHVEGTQFLWSNNSFTFTSPDALKAFAELDYAYRKKIQHVTFRLIAKFYDDQDRTHRLPRTHHPELQKSIKLVVHKRAKGHPMDRRGFRTYGWYQLVDFLAAMLPPFDPSADAPASTGDRPRVRPRLLPSLEQLRIDFVNFGEELFSYPPPQLHDLATHQLGCTLNELTLTGIPKDESGIRVANELSGLVRDEGLVLEAGPTMVALKHGIRLFMSRADTKPQYPPRVVRGMRTVSGTYNLFSAGAHHPPHIDLPPAPADQGEPPVSPYHSCRTIWKKIPVNLLDRTQERKWELFDRVSGMPWDMVEEEATMFDFADDDDEEEDAMLCENCGEIHPGALLPEELMDLYDDM